MITRDHGGGFYGWSRRRFGRRCIGTRDEELIRGGDENPIPALLLLLVISVGVPFFMISTTNPLLQKWFTETGHPAARDPYFLYAASNIGSMLALLAYPVLPPLVRDPAMIA